MAASLAAASSVNIVLIGRTGCGKKTVANHIIGCSNEELDCQSEELDCQSEELDCQSKELDCQSEDSEDSVDMIGYLPPNRIPSCKPAASATAESLSRAIAEEHQSTRSWGRRLSDRFQTADDVLSGAVRKAGFARKSFERVKSMGDSDVNVGIADISGCGAPVKDSDVWSHIKSLSPRHEIHLILFVLTRSDIDDEEDLDQKHFFKITWKLEEKVEMSDEIYRHFAVVVTHCDGLNDEAKETLIHKVKHSKVGVTIKIEEERIFCVTFPSDQKKRKLLKEEVEQSSKQLQDFAKNYIEQAVIQLKEDTWADCMTRLLCC